MNETVPTSSLNIPYVNNGKASFSISGIAAVGNTLTINQDEPDPDGAGTLSYSWQISNDGNNWKEVSTSSTFLIASSEEGKSIKAVISYKDGQGFDELVSTDALSIPFTLNNVETKGLFTLAKNNKGDGYIAPAGTGDFTPITDKNGDPLGDTSYPGWKLVGADTVDGINRTAWKHDSYGFFFHKHDANWKEIFGGSVIPIGSNDFYKMETSFVQDFDGDGFTGAPQQILDRLPSP